MATDPTDPTDPMARTTDPPPDVPDLLDVVTVRPASPDDHDRVVVLVDDWWGRPIAAVLPRLFLDHFFATSLVAEAGDEIVGFLVGFDSPSRPDEAYIHFVGVHPGWRRRHLARQLYEQFFTQARAHGRLVVRALTTAVNEQSISFHRRMGFSVEVPVRDYDRPGTEQALFRIVLDP